MLPVMLPTDEFVRLVGIAGRAVDLAAEDRLAEGYALLLSGLTRALECESAGKPFGAELVARWCWVCEWYSGRYHGAGVRGVHVAANPTEKP
jgi:hypothetical protein